LSTGTRHENGSHGIGSGGIALREQMRVGVEQSSRVVSESSGDDVQRYRRRCRQGERGGRVAQDMKLPPVFRETFTSTTLGGPPATTPTSKGQCKHGGWKNFGGLFKNQGQCVSSVAAQQA
jgi:hypothetical protein